MSRSHILFLDDTRIPELGISTLGGLLVAEGEYVPLQKQLQDLKDFHLGDPHAGVKWSPGQQRSSFSGSAWSGRSAPAACGTVRPPWKHGWPLALRMHRRAECCLQSRSARAVPTARARVLVSAQ